MLGLAVMSLDFHTSNVVKCEIILITVPYLGRRGLTSIEGGRGVPVERLSRQGNKRPRYCYFRVLTWDD